MACQHKGNPSLTPANSLLSKKSVTENLEPITPSIDEQQVLTEDVTNSLHNINEIKVKTEMISPDPVKTQDITHTNKNQESALILKNETTTPTKDITQPTKSQVVKPACKKFSSPAKRRKRG